MLYSIIFTISIIAQNGQVGFLSIDNKDSLMIYLDSIPVSNRSFDSLCLEPGIYHLRAIPDNSLNWLNGGDERTVEILPDSCLKLELEKSIYINLNSVPYGCEVHHHDHIIGTTPLLIKKKDFLNDSLLLKKQGYLEQTITIGERQDHYRAILERINGAKESPVIKNRQEKKYIHWEREGLLICSILTGWGSFIFKREADHYYDKYQKTTSPQLIETYYNRTKNYDRWAEISLGVSIISLGSYFYLLIKD
jgi:hypothetical protein